MAGRRDRDEMAVKDSRLMLGLWTLSGQPVCFKANGAMLYIGLVEDRRAVVLRRNRRRLK